MTAGEPCGEVESTKSVSDLYSPVDGEVIEVNAGASRTTLGWSTPTPTGRAGCSRSALSDDEGELPAGLLRAEEYTALTKEAE